MRVRPPPNDAGVSGQGIRHGLKISQQLPERGRAGAGAGHPDFRGPTLSFHLAEEGVASMHLFLYTLLGRGLSLGRKEAHMRHGALRCPPYGL